MARNRKTNRRRRRGRFSALLRLLCTALVIGAIVAAMTLFFKVQNIVVSGNERYREEEIVAVSGIKLEDNLFLLNKYNAAQSIFEQLPYIEETTIHRKLPDTIVITVRECSAAAGIEAGGSIWLVSESGKLLEQTDALPEGCPAVSGVEPLDPAVSAQLTGDEENAAAAAQLLVILQSARERGILEQIERIDLSDATAIRLEYLGRFTVKLPWESDMDSMLGAMQTVAGKLETNETGEISLMNLAEKGKANFIPKSQ